MEKLRVVVVDDEALARERLSHLLKEAGCEVLAELADGTSLLSWLAINPKVDALFLDIQMPGASGLELLADFPDLPAVTFVTAHPDFAVTAFELSAADYILKPVSADRVAKSIEKIRKQQTSLLPDEVPQKNLAAAQPQRFAVKAGSGKVFLELKHITHFELNHGVIWAWCGGKRFRSPWKTLGEVEKAFSKADFIRIQRNLLLRPGAVTAYSPLSTGRIKVRVWENLELEASRSITPALKKVLGLS